MLAYNPPRYLFRRYKILKKTRRGENFLEIGAGGLKLSRELLKFFDKGTIVDFEQKVVEIHKTLPEAEKARLKIILADFLKDQPAEKFDMAVACEVMEHIKDDGVFLKTVYGSLKPGGQIIISVPAHQKYWSVHDEIAGHFKRYEKPELPKLFAGTGFENIRIYSYGYPFINLLWVMRKLHSKGKDKPVKQWSQEKKSAESGVGEISTMLKIIGLLFNKYIFYPFNVVSSMFDNFDLSEGYVITATKGSK